MATEDKDKPTPPEVAAQALKKQTDLVTRCAQSPNGRHSYRPTPYQCYYCQLNKPS